MLLLLQLSAVARTSIEYKLSIIDKLLHMLAESLLPMTHRCWLGGTLLLLMSHVLILSHCISWRLLQQVVEISRVMIYELVHTMLVHIVQFNSQSQSANPNHLYHIHRE